MINRYLSFIVAFKILDALLMLDRHHNRYKLWTFSGTGFV